MKFVETVGGCMNAYEVGNLHFIAGNMNKFVYLGMLKDNLVESETKT